MVGCCCFSAPVCPNLSFYFAPLTSHIICAPTHDSGPSFFSGRTYSTFLERTCWAAFDLPFTLSHGKWFCKREILISAVTKSSLRISHHASCALFFYVGWYAPQSNRLILRCCGEQPTVRRERDANNYTLMSLEHWNLAPTHHIEQPQPAR